MKMGTVPLAIKRPIIVTILLASTQTGNLIGCSYKQFVWKHKIWLCRFFPQTEEVLLSSDIPGPKNKLPLRSLPSLWVAASPINSVYSSLQLLDFSLNFHSGPLTSTLERTSNLDLTTLERFFARFAITLRIFVHRQDSLWTFKCF